MYTPKDCAYCGKTIVKSSDYEKEHVFARAWYVPSAANPILVASCKKCNGNKSRIETWCPIVFSIASGMSLTEAQNRGLKNIPKRVRDVILDGTVKWVKINGILQEKVVIEIPFWDEIEVLFKEIGIGILHYYRKDDIFIRNKFPHCNMVMLPHSSERDLNVLLRSAGYIENEKNNTFSDTTRYCGKIQYAGFVSEKFATVCFQIYNPNFFGEKKEQMRVVMLNFSTN